MITKAKLREQIDNMPDYFTIDDLVAKLVFLDKVESGLNDSNGGNKITEMELESKMKEWFN